MLARLLSGNSECVDAQQPNLARALQSALIGGDRRSETFGLESYVDEENEDEDEDNEQAYANDQASKRTSLQALSAASERFDGQLHLDSSWVRVHVTAVVSLEQLLRPNAHVTRARANRCSVHPRLLLG